MTSKIDRQCRSRFGWYLKRQSQPTATLQDRYFEKLGVKRWVPAYAESPNTRAVGTGDGHVGQTNYARDESNTNSFAATALGESRLRHGRRTERGSGHCGTWSHHLFQKSKLRRVACPPHILRRAQQHKHIAWLKEEAAMRSPNPRVAGASS